jgi:hypothetical protein
MTGDRSSLNSSVYHIRSRFWSVPSAIADIHKKQKPEEYSPGFKYFNEVRNLKSKI